MGKPSIGLLCDLPEHSGIGKYGKYLQRLLQDGFDMEIVYFNYEERSLDAVRGKERRTLANTPRLPLLDNKPWFWQRVKAHIPRYDLKHVISQNLSFLVHGNGNALVTCHDIAPLFSPSNPWERWGRRRLYSGLRRAQLILADSESTRWDLMQAFHIPPERMQVVPLGVDRTIFRPLDKKDCRKKLDIPLEAKVILNVAIDKWRKNVGGLIRAAASLIKEIPEVILILAGTPSPRTRELVRTMGLGDKFRAVKPPSEDELVTLYNTADVFAFPSFYEGFGLPVLEAMACGTPVVATNRTSVPEVVGEAGILINPEDTSELAKEIKRVLTDKPLSETLSARGLARSSEFTWEKTAEATGEAYQSVLGTRN